MIGLWHELSVQYFLWGLLHGIGLVSSLEISKLKISKKILKTQSFVLKNVANLICISLTILFVSFVQTIANLPGMNEVGYFVWAFFK